VGRRGAALRGMPRLAGGQGLSTRLHATACGRVGSGRGLAQLGRAASSAPAAADWSRRPGAAPSPDSLLSLSLSLSALGPPGARLGRPVGRKALSQLIWNTCGRQSRVQRASTPASRARSVGRGPSPSDSLRLAHLDVHGRQAAEVCARRRELGMLEVCLACVRGTAATQTERGPAGRRRQRVRRCTGLEASSRSKATAERRHAEAAGRRRGRRLRSPRPRRRARPSP
jgi:hypothetical protein